MLAIFHISFTFCIIYTVQLVVYCISRYVCLESNIGAITILQLHIINLLMKVLSAGVRNGIPSCNMLCISVSYMYVINASNII